MQVANFLHIALYLSTDEDLEKCCARIFKSPIFERENHHDLRSELIELAKCADISNTRLYIIYVLIILSGRCDPETFRQLREARFVPILCQVIQANVESDTRLHRVGVELLYEVSRTQQFSGSDMDVLDAELIQLLFERAEKSESAVYTDSLVRLIISLNEQFMVAEVDPVGKQYTFLGPPSSSGPPSPPTQPLVNKIFDLLSAKPYSFRGVGEKMIFILNRERQYTLQLLMLKFLYLIFITPATYDYFYSNDLRVLVDVFIRELYDLPEDHENVSHLVAQIAFDSLATAYLSPCSISTSCQFTASRTALLQA